MTMIILSGYVSTILSYLSNNNQLCDKVVILVGNKTDLVRSRSVTTDQGCDLAVKFGTKFTETSAGLCLIGNMNMNSMISF